MKLTAKQVAADLELSKAADRKLATINAKSGIEDLREHRLLEQAYAERADEALSDYAEALQEAMLRLQSCHDELKCEQRNCPTGAVIDDFFELEGSGEGKK
jgi:hypothetical protein